jgi:hypothetical protein
MPVPTSADMGRILEQKIPLNAHLRALGMFFFVAIFLLLASNCMLSLVRGEVNFQPLQDSRDVHPSSMSFYTRFYLHILFEHSVLTLRSSCSRK